jgi:HEAT repeats
MKTATATHRCVLWLPKISNGRVILGLSLLVAALFGLAGFVVFSIWIEDRFPSVDAKRALLPAAQRLVTKPVVDSLSRQIQRHIRIRAEAPFMYGWLSLDETIARFLDERVDLAERRLYAYRLAREGSPAAVAALLKVFRTALPEDKAFMVQLVGSTGNPAAKSWLWLLLDDVDPRVVAAAINGLSSIGGDDVTGRLVQILNDNQRSDEIRIEAASGLGTIRSDVARQALIEALGRSESNELAAEILNNLGRFEFSTVADTFQEYLAPQTTNGKRVAAAEALAFSSREAVPLLLNVAQGDSDVEVRASAAWAISAHSTVTELGPSLTDLVENERSADVRRRLYEALLPQKEIPADRLLPIVKTEQDIAARVAGFNAIGRATRQQPTTAAAAVFDQEIVAELLAIATTPNTLNIQMRAVFALRTAQTTASQDALRTIADTATAQVATAAHNGLPRNN